MSLFLLFLRNPVSIAAVIIPAAGQPILCCLLPPSQPGRQRGACLSLAAGRTPQGLPLFAPLPGLLLFLLLPVCVPLAAVAPQVLLLLPSVLSELGHKDALIHQAFQLRFPHLLALFLLLLLLLLLLPQLLSPRPQWLMLLLARWPMLLGYDHGRRCAVPPLPRLLHLWLPLPPEAADTWAPAPSQRAGGTGLGSKHHRRPPGSRERCSVGWLSHRQQC